MVKNEKEILNDVEEQHEQLQSRIDSLYGLGDAPVKRSVELSEDEKRQIRKKMVLLIWFCVLMGGLMIFNTIYPISGFFEKKEVEKVKEQEKLPNLPSGDVPLDNEEIQTMIGMFNFDINNPLYETNIEKLFDGKQNVEDMDFELQMFLLTSNDKFNEYMRKNTIIEEYLTTMTEIQITVPKDKIEIVAEKVFGEKITMEHQNFKYYYNYGDDKLVYFDAVLDETTGIYTLAPIEQPAKPKTEMHLKPFSADNINDTIYINCYIVYTNEKGIYSDVKTNNLLSNDVTKLNDIISYGSKVEIVFERVVNQQNSSINYYLKVTNGN